MSVFEPLTRGTLINYTQLSVGAPAGDRYVVACEKCGRPGIAHGRKCLHRVRYLQTPAGNSVQTIVDACNGGAPKKVDPPRTQTGFPFCPKEWL